ncbi:hypothetical protein PTTG_27729 [Puccinia triticina 1-1 BBBD Race 1]|uniref:Uncharacterized protein n=1 Tax=Puccinia triticina (isolate 1-1 / race 1 (BBBD)) TaxID=630390 RepID=A0A180GJL4_PUCT1|nr:hypothetical protein PTTG_27729 [Puccinia triticina 1-1 BBBD Race 1]
MSYFYKHPRCSQSGAPDWSGALTAYFAHRIPSKDGSAIQDISVRQSLVIDQCYVKVRTFHEEGWTENLYATGKCSNDPETGRPFEPGTLRPVGLNRADIIQSHGVNSQMGYGLASHYGQGFPAHFSDQVPRQHYGHSAGGHYGSQPFSHNNRPFRDTSRQNRMNTRNFQPEFNRSFTTPNPYHLTGSNFHSSAPYASAKSRKRFKGYNGPPRNFVDDRAARPGPSGDSPGQSAVVKK